VPMLLYVRVRHLVLMEFVQLSVGVVEEGEMSNPCVSNEQCESKDERIADLERKLAAAREVIKPFANEMKCIWDISYDDLEVPARIKIGDLRRAAQWMKDN